jgi:hypothetical protein
VLSRPPPTNAKKPAALPAPPPTNAPCGVVLTAAHERALTT